MPRGKIIFEWQQSRSEASKAAWERKYERAWELGEERKLGPKGQAYLEQKYGPVEVPPEQIPEDYYEDRDFDLYDEEDSP